MAIPEQIRKQTEAVQELYKQLNDEESSTDTAVVEEPTPTPEADGSSVQSVDSSENIEQSTEESSPELYVQKYKTLQGMYNAEVPRLHATNRELQSRISQMEQLLSTLSQPQSQPQVQSQSYVSDAEREEYGESLDVMRKVSKEELTPLFQRIQYLESMLGQVSNTIQTNVMPQISEVSRQQAISAEDRFWGTLSERVPNWQQINSNPSFQGWLLEVDPISGVSRQAYLDQAQSNLDVDRVVQFFSTWAKQTGNTAYANAQPNRSASASELEKQVVPGRGRGGSSVTQSAKTYSPDDIKTFFSDVRSGRYKGREAERDRIERDIFAAQREGRIVANA